jgi:hypothetical protein
MLNIECCIRTAANSNERYQSPNFFSDGARRKYRCSYREPFQIMLRTLEHSLGSAWRLR